MATAFQLAIQALFKGEGFKKLKKELNDVNQKAKDVTNNMNNALGGKRIENHTRSLATNLGAVGNRLGFLAFQWKFMAGAAQQALFSVLGGLKEVLQVGSEINTKMGQALAFGSDIMGIANQTAEARAELSAFRDEIVKFGSGKTIFNRGEIADIGKELQKAFDDVNVTKDALGFAAQLKQLDETLDNEKLATGLVTLFEATGVNLRKGDDTIEGRTKRLEEMGKAVDFLSNVSDKSSLNFQSTISSFSKAAPLAKQLGLEATELGTVLQVAGDVLGRNKSSGRAGSSAGTYTNAFLSDLTAIADATTKQGKFARQIGLDIFEKDGAGGTLFKPLIRQAGEVGDDIVQVFSKKFKKLSAADRSAAFSQLGLSDNSQLVANALIFDKTTEELQDMREELKEMGTLQVRAAASVADTGSQMKRLQAAVDGVKSAFTAGLAPIIKEVADIMEKFASDPEFNEMMASIGIIIGDFVRPALQKLAKILKTVFNIFKKNPRLLKAVTIGVTLLVGALAGLFILSSIGFLVTVVGASLVTMGAQAGIASGGLFALGKAGFTAALRFVPFIFLMVGIAAIIGLLTGAFEGELIPIMAAVGVGATALGAAMLIPHGNVKLLTAGLLALKDRLFGTKVAAKAVQSSMDQFLEQRKKWDIGSFLGTSKTAPSTQGANIGTKFVQGISGALTGPQGIGQKLIGALGGLARGGPILAAVAAVAIIATAMLLELDKRVKNDPFFKGGFASYWETAGFQAKAAVASTMRGIIEFFEAGFAFIKEGIDNFFQKVFNLGVAAGDFFASLASFDPEKIRQAAEAMAKAFTDAFTFDDIVLPDFGKEIRELFDVEFLARNELQKRLDKFADVLKHDTVEFQTIVDSLAEVVSRTGTGDLISSAEIIQMIRDQLGEQIFEQQNVPTGGLEDSIEEAEAKLLDEGIQFDYQDSVVESTEAITENTTTVTQQNEEQKKQVKGIQEANKVQTEMKKQNGFLNKEILARLTGLKDVTNVTKTETESLTKSNTAIGEGTKSEEQNTKVVDENSLNVGQDSKAITEHIDFAKLSIVEIARNINAMSSMTSWIARVNVMWAQLIAEGNRMAGKLASAWMDSEGKWHYRDPGISAGDQSKINEAKQDLAATLAGQMIIDINSLKEELAKIQATLEEANNVAKETQTSIKEAGNVVSDTNEAVSMPSMQDIFNEYGNPNYSARIIRPEDNGPIQIDLFIDEKIDMTVEGGQLSDEQYAEIKRQVGSSVADQIREALGVEAV